MEQIRVVFLGNDAWSVLPMEAIADSSLDLALVATRTARPAGRGSSFRRTAVAELAEERDLPLLEIDSVRGDDALDALRRAEPDVLAVVAYGEILPRPVLEMAPLGAVNLHFSLLPRWRGASPVRRAIWEGDEMSGVTTMLIDEGLDTGPILQQQEEEIAPEDDARSLGERLAAIGAPLLVRTIEGLAERSIEPRPQDETLATVAPKLTKDDRRLVWSRDAGHLVRQIRALSPDPGASTAFRDATLKIFAARAEGWTEEGHAPGEVVEIGEDGVLVAAGVGAVRPLQVAQAGRRRMTAAEFARGARIAVGERLG
jgi:methionyl-tRNA formyltransferase